MDTPMKSYSTTKGKAKSLPMGKGKHAVNPTMGNGPMGKAGVDSLNGAHGNKSNKR